MPRLVCLQLNVPRLTPHVLRLQPHVLRLQPHVLRLQPHVPRLQPYVPRLQPMCPDCNSVYLGGAAPQPAHDNRHAARRGRLLPEGAHAHRMRTVCAPYAPCTGTA